MYTYGRDKKYRPVIVVDLAKFKSSDVLYFKLGYYWYYWCNEFFTDKNTRVYVRSI